MNRRLDRAKQLLESGCALAIVNGGGELTFDERGIVTLLKLQHGSLGGAFVADKVVGKAAALLLVRGGALEVYAEVISEPALEVLAKHRVLCIHKEVVKNIMNNDDTDICPMESAVLEVDDPDSAFELLAEKTGFAV